MGSFFGHEKSFKEFFADGIEAMMQSDYEAAFKCFEMAQNIEPTNLAVWPYIAVIRLNHSARDAAMSAMNEYLEIHQSNPEALCCMGILYFVSNRYEEAREYFEKALQVDSRNLFAWFGKSMVLNQVAAIANSTLL